MALSSKLLMLEMNNSKELLMKSTNFKFISSLSCGVHIFWINFFSKINDKIKFEVRL